MENSFIAPCKTGGKVAYCFVLCLVLSFLVFYVFIPIILSIDDTAPAIPSPVSTPYISRFPPPSNGANSLVENHLGAPENNLATHDQMAPGSNGTERVNYHDGRGLIRKKNETLPGVVGSAHDDGGGAESTSTPPDDGSDDREMRSLKECDIFDGRWVRDEREPFYPPGSCPYVDTSINCHANGRPDGDFLNWRWQPNHCDIPRMNATDFLERLRGQRLIFVGDSLNRNMWESLICTLHQSVAKKERVFEISGGTEFKSRPYSSFKFMDYNCTVEFVRAPYLVKQILIKKPTGERINRLRLDMIEKAASIYRGADIMIFNTGHWWGHEKTGKNYFQVDDYVYPYLPQIEAYQKGLSTWARWIDRNIDTNKTHVFFRGFSLGHFRGGRWNSGGTCHNETEPIYNEKFLEEYPSTMLVAEKILKKMKTSVTYLNITRLTSYRKDGHPAIYRRKFENVEDQIASIRIQDCSHWCLPGVPDAWNELLYVSLLKINRGPWKN